MREVKDSISCIQDIPVVCQYLDVFPNELPGLPPEREPLFEIKLIPGTQPSFKSPYRMAFMEQAEL